MPVTDGQLFINATGGSASGADLIEIQAGTTPFQVGGQTTPIQRPLVRSYLDRQAPAVPFQKFYQQNFTTEIKATAGAPSADTNLPEIHRLLQASGMSYALSGSLHTYTWLADPNSSATDYQVDARWEELTDGNYYVSTKCNYSFEMTGSADAVPTATWSGAGTYAVPVAVDSNLGDDRDAQGPPVIPITAYSIAGADSGVVIRDWSISSGLQLTQRGALSGTNGFEFPSIFSRADATRVTLTIEAVDETTKDYFGRWAAGTLADLELTLGNGTRTIKYTLNQVAFDAPVIAQGTPNMMTLAGAASSGNNNETSSLTIEFG